MSKRITIRIPAVPVAQPRPRSTVRNGRAATYEQKTIKQSDGTRKPHPIVAFKATVRMAAEKTYRGPPLDGPLRCDVLLVFPRTKAQIWETKPMPRLWHDKKPDRDNCDKAVMDALAGLLWQDDRQVSDGRITKLIAAGDEQPHVVVTVTPLKQ